MTEDVEFDNPDDLPPSCERCGIGHNSWECPGLEDPDYEPPPEHRYDGDSDTCVCGGEVVYFEDGDDDGRPGYGCEASGRVWETNPNHPRGAVLR